MPTDDNPFARNSVWPKMPQRPFRVASLPRPPEPQTAEPLAPAEPPRQTITPVFVRSTEAAAPAFTRPVVAPPPVRPSPPVIQPQVPPAAVAAPFIAPTSRFVPRKAPIWPGLIAGAVGLAGVAGLVMLLTRDQPAPSAVAPPLIASAPPVAAPSVAAPSVAAPSVAAPPAAVTPGPAEPDRAKPSAPEILARSTRLAVRRLPAAPPTYRAADAAQAAHEVPVLTLPPAPPPPSPAAETLPFKPDAAPDPNAPITTRRPYN